MDRMDSIYFSFKIRVSFSLMNFRFEAYGWNEFSGYSYIPDPIGVLGFTIGKYSNLNKKRNVELYFNFNWSVCWF